MLLLDIFDWIYDIVSSSERRTLSLIAISVTVLILILGKLLSFHKQQRELRILNCFTPDQIISHSRYYVMPKIKYLVQRKDGSTQFIFKDGIQFFKRSVFPTHNINKHYIILGESGMGKTSFLINLLKKSIPLIPSVKYLWTPRYKLAISPIDVDDLQEAIEDIRSKNVPEETILLLDGLDEDEKAEKNTEKRIDEIIKWTQGFRKIIITCRTQFFNSEEEEPGKLKIRYPTDGRKHHVFTKIYIVPFSESEVKRYLNKRFFSWKFWKVINLYKKRLAFSYINKIPDLAARPLLLTYIDDLLPEEKRTAWLAKRLLAKDIVTNFHLTSVPYFQRVVSIINKQTDKISEDSQFSTKLHVYKTIILRWVERESNHIFNADKQTIFRRDILKLAIYSAEIFANTDGGLDKLAVERDKIFNRASEEKLSIRKKFISSRSLLSRNRHGEITFSHKSILEYFLALISVYNINIYRKIFNKKGFENYDDFISEMIIIKYILPFFNNADSFGNIEILFEGQSKFKAYHTALLQDEIFRIKSFRIKKNIGYVEYIYFVGLPNLSIDAFVGLLKYYAFILNRSSFEVMDFLKKTYSLCCDDYYLVSELVSVCEYYGLEKHAINILEDHLSKELSSGSYSSKCDNLMELYRQVGNISKYTELLKAKFKSDLVDKGKSNNLYALSTYVNHLWHAKCYDLAIEAYSLYANSREVDARYASREVSRCYIAKGDIEGALAMMINEYESNIDVSYFSTTIVDCFLRAKNISKARNFINTHLERTKVKNYNFVNECVDLFIENGYLVEGANLYKEFFNDDFDIKKRLKIIEYYQMQNQTSKVIELLESQINQDESDFESCNNIALIYSKEDDYEKSLHYHKLCVERVTNELVKKPSLKPMSERVYYHNLGVAYFGYGQIDKAIPLFEKSMRTQTYSSRIIENCHYHLADCYFDKQQYEKSFDIYNRLFATTSKMIYLEKAIESALLAGKLTEVFRFNTFMNEHFTEEEKVEYIDLQNRVKNYLVDHEIFINAESDKLHRKIFDKYYNAIVDFHLNI